MRGQARLDALIDQGVIEEVERPLLAGKEAAVFLVWSHGRRCVAKIYKEASNRSFKHRSTYTEGRRGRNSRRERAMAKRSKYGRAEEEAAWQNAEVDAIYSLRAAGVTVPEPLEFVDGVLIMELVTDGEGEPAPRLCDMRFEADEARVIFDQLIRETVRMLCAGLVHGDLSDFNVLLGPNGPVIIDFPQAVDAAANNQAKQLLIRDVDNLQQFLGRWVPNLKKMRYGEEIWGLYEKGDLRPDSPLTGHFKRASHIADTSSILEEIEAAQREARRRKGLPPLDSLSAGSFDDRPTREVDLPPKGRRGKKRGRSSEAHASTSKPSRPPKDRGARAAGPAHTPSDAASSKGGRKRKRKRGVEAPTAVVEQRPSRSAAATEPDFDDLDALLSFDD